jgi:hypothetical protein
VVVATFLPLSCAIDVMPELAFHRNAHFLDERGDGKGHVLLARGVVGRGAALDVDRAVLYQRNAVLRGDGLILDLELGQTELLLDVGQRAGADVHMEADVLAITQGVAQCAGRLAHTHRDGAAVLDLLQRVGLRGTRGDQCGGHGHGADQH